MHEIINLDHKSVVAFKDGHYRWLLVATYHNGTKAVIHRKTELWGDARVPVTTEFVISTADDDAHLRRIMRYAMSMLPNHHENN